MKVLTTVPVSLLYIVIVPLFVVFVEVDQVSYQAVCVFPNWSTLSMNIVVTDPIVALLYATNPAPGSASVVVVEKLYLVPPATPEVPEEPLDPDVPDDPLEPDVPDDPLEPDVPDDPLEPDVPDEPEEPEVPTLPVLAN